MKRDAVLGQEVAYRYFSSSCQRLAHAYLFAGPAGVGKASFALLSAKVLLCKTPNWGSWECCGRCYSCMAMQGGAHPRFHILRAESGKSIEIDRVRDLTATLAVGSGERRIVLIPDAEALALQNSSPAANALLKTLEEPPAGGIFILTTAAPGRLLPTIVSRCQRIPFFPLAPADFFRVCEFDEELSQLREVFYHASRGSPGRALRLQEFVRACGGLQATRHFLLEGWKQLPETIPEIHSFEADGSRKQQVRALFEFFISAWPLLAENSGQLPQLASPWLLRCQRVDELLHDLDGNLNPELLLEEFSLIMNSEASFV